MLGITNEIYDLRKKYSSIREDVGIESKTKEGLLNELTDQRSVIELKKESILSRELTLDIDGKKTPTSESDFENFLSNDDNVSKIINGEVNVQITNRPDSIDLLNSRISEIESTKKGSTVTEDAKLFAEKLGVQEDVSEFVKGATKIPIGNTDVIIKSEGDNIKIESISTPKDKRGNGSARKAIEKITSIADSDGKTLELNVVPLDETTSAEKLVEFYEKQGFVKEENFSLDGGKMVRQPRDTKNFFNPLESEGESIGRLSKSVSEGKTAEQVANEHNESYLKYLKQQEVGKEVLNSEFVTSFKERLQEALSKSETFDFKQERSQKNGSRIDENGETIKEFDYLEQQGSLEPSNDFDNIDKLVSKVQEPILIKTQLNDYTVDVLDGELNIVPKFGKKKPSGSEIQKITKQYIENTDFDYGDRVDFSETGNISQDQISDLIAEKSENPIEVAQEIISVQERVSDNNESNETSKTGAIAQALSGVQVNKDSFAQTDDRNNIGGVNPFYFSSRSKSQTGRGGKGMFIDEIRESAQQYTNQEIELEDITDFIKEFRNPNDVSENSNNATFELESRFKELTGIKPTTQNVKLIADSNKIQEDDSILENDDEVPFQTDSYITQFEGG